MAMYVTAVVGVAPCQCFSPGGNQITSPGRMSSMGPPQRWTRPQPAVTISVWRSLVAVPCFPSAGFNRDTHPDRTCRSGCLEQGVKADRAGKVLGRSFPGRLRATSFDVHSLHSSTMPTKAERHVLCLMVIIDAPKPWVVE